MSEENKAIVRKFYEMLELGDPGLADEIVAADYVSHNTFPSPDNWHRGDQSNGH